MDTPLALVTGATGTIGRRIAIDLASAGVDVVVAGRNPGLLDDLLSELRAISGRSLSERSESKGIIIDQADLASVEAAITQLTTGDHRPTVLVNVAGEFGPLKRVIDTTFEEWDHTLTLDFRSFVLLTMGLLPAMIDGGWGRVIQVSSAAAIHEPRAGNSAYSVSKAASNRFLGHLADELTGTGVTAHAMHPGEIVSNMWQVIADAAQADGSFTNYSSWVESTKEDPEDPDAAGRSVVSLLDDATAARENGRFVWAQQPERESLPLT